MAIWLQDFYPSRFINLWTYVSLEHTTPKSHLAFSANFQPWKIIIMFISLVFSVSVQADVTYIRLTPPPFIKPYLQPWPSRENLEESLVSHFESILRKKVKKNTKIFLPKNIGGACSNIWMKKWMKSKIVLRFYLCHCKAEEKVLSLVVMFD